MKIPPLAAVMVATSIAPALAQPYRNLTDEQLIQREDRLDDICRGGRVNAPTTHAACNERERASDALYARGYCVVGNSGAEQRWAIGPASRWTQRGENAVCGDGFHAAVQ